MATTGIVGQDANFALGLSSRNVRGTRVTASALNVEDVEGRSATFSGGVTAQDVVDSSNIKYYGAVGDGVTDDTAAIQAALDTPNISLYFPPGAYAVSSTLVMSGTKLIWAGRATVTITPLAGTTPSPTLRINGSFNRVQGLFINSTTGAGSIAVELGGTSNILSDCETSSGVETAVLVTGNECLIENGWIKSTTTDIRVDTNKFGNMFVNNRKTGGSTYLSIDDGGNHVVINGRSSVIPVTFTNGVQNVVLIGNYAVTADGASTYTHVTGTGIVQNTLPVLGSRKAAVADPVGGGTVDVEARAQLSLLLSRLRATGGHGLIAD